MAKYLLLKHYRGAPAAGNDVPMDQWTPDEVEAHFGFMRDFAARLELSGEIVDGQALSPEGAFVRAADIHPRPFADRLQPFQHLDGRGGIAGGGGCGRSGLDGFGRWLGHRRKDGRNDGRSLGRDHRSRL